MPNNTERSYDRVLQSNSKEDKLDQEVQDGAGHNVIGNPGFSTMNE